MALNFYSRFNSVKDWVKIEDKNIPERLRNKKLFSLLVDIFDDNFFTSKASYIGNVILIILILISTVEIILNSDLSLVQYAPWFRVIDRITTIVFSIEIFIRITLAGYIHKKYKGWRGKIRYMVSFYGIVDMFSIFPSYIGFIGSDPYHWSKILRLFRIWRIVRYVPAFSNITGAIRRKGNEILVSLAGIILLSLTISLLIFYAEKGAGSKDFDSIFDVFVWSIGKYTGDYGSIAKEIPLTILGKVLATLNGVLGIALFALPAGLLGAAFIEQMEENKRNEKVKHRIKSIDLYFDSNSNDQLLHKKRFVTFDELQARFLFTNDEIIEAIRKSNSLCFRAVKSDSNNKFNDIEIIERFDKNVSYGCKIIKENSNIFIVNPSGALYTGISHFTHNIASSLKYNYLSLEQRIFKREEIELEPRYSDLKVEIFKKGKSTDDKPPKKLTDFMNDIKEINPNDFIFIFCVNDNLSEDFDFEYGNNEVGEFLELENSKGCKNYMFRKFELALKRRLNSFNMSLSNMTELGKKGSFRQTWIGKEMKNENTLTIYINSNILISDDDKYSQVLKCFKDIFKEIFES
jgi:hypothetical protein